MASTHTQGSIGNDAIIENIKSPCHNASLKTATRGTDQVLVCSACMKEIEGLRRG